MKKLLVAVLAAAFPFALSASCMTGDNWAHDNDDHYAYWRTVEGQNWVNEYGECWRTVNDPSYHNTLDEALVCGDAEEAYTVIRTNIIVHFDFDKSDLRTGDIGHVRSLMNDVRKVGGSVINIDIVGHTDSRGSEAYNDALGLRRAKALGLFLKALDLPVGEVVSRGELELVDTTGTEDGHQANRRAEGTVTLEVTYIRRK